MSSAKVASEIPLNPADYATNCDRDLRDADNLIASNSANSAFLSSPSPPPRDASSCLSHMCLAEKSLSCCQNASGTGRLCDHNVVPKSTSPRTLAVILPSNTTAAEDTVAPKIEEVDDDGDNEDNIAVDSESKESQFDCLDVGSIGKSDNGINTRRKRGRPRKNPVPISPTIKCTKGRSKTGCITCRRRKKKCDETKPTCLNCQKNSVVCEGYPAKEIWRSGKQKIEEVASRLNPYATFNRGLPILIDGIETDIDRRFLDHFVNNFSRVLTLINDDSNPFKEIVLPMAMHHSGLMHSLMCLAGSHLSACDPEPSLKDRKHYHLDRAVSSLREAITARSLTDADKRDDLHPVEDPVIASTVALCLHTICEGETRGEYRSHMDAARYFLARQRPGDEKFRQFILEFFQYHDISNSISTLDRRPTRASSDFQQLNLVPHKHAGALLGISDGLFHLMSEITVIRDTIRQRINRGLEPQVDYHALSESVKIDSRIRSWDSSYPVDDPNWLASHVFRQSAWVYLYRTIRPSCPDEKISQVVDDGLRFLDLLPPTAGANSLLLLPVFLLGCSAFYAYQRERIKLALDVLQAYSSLRNIQPTLRVLEKIWEVMDSNPTQSWDWEKIIEDMNMDFLIT